MSFNWRMGIALLGFAALTAVVASRAGGEPATTTAATGPATTQATTQATTHAATTRAVTRPATTKVATTASSKPTSLPALPATFPVAKDAKPQAVPSEERLAEAERVVRHTFADAYKDASRAGRRGLGNLFLQRGRSRFDEPAVRYVLLREARDAFADGGDATGVTAAIEEMARQFKIDARAMRVEALQRTAAKAEIDADYAALAATGIALVDETFAGASTPDDFASAARLGMATITWASASHDGTLMIKSRAWNSDVQAAAAEAARIQPAFEKLKKSPDDADANAAVGKFRCFYQNDWSLGVPLLAKGSDANLASLARLELVQPTKTGDQMKLADAWWAQSQAANGLPKARLLQRACLWYGRLYPKLTGPQRNHVERRLTEAGYTAEDLQELHLQ